MSRDHVIDRSMRHFKWDRSEPPVVEIEPGDTVHFETQEVSDGQLTPASTGADLVNLDFDRLYPLGGPVYVKGAEPGDALEVEILALDTVDWGWAGLIPGLGLLAEDFPDPYLRVFDLTNGKYTELRDDIRIPIQPFCGTMGVAPDEPGRLDVLPPTKGAGNIDTRHLTAGTTLRLPVFVPGALFSAGDCHAAQGDGEVCVTGIECPMKFSLRFNVVKGAAPRPWSYQFTTPPGSLQAPSDTKGYLAMSALGPDLMENSKNAVRDLIRWLQREKSLSAEDAYVLCSLAADLKVSQIVDQPTWGVSAYLSLAVFA